MTDYVLEISFPSDLEDVVQGKLFLTRSSGNAVFQPGIIEAYFDSVADRDAAVARMSCCGHDMQSRGMK